MARLTFDHARIEKDAQALWKELDLYTSDLTDEEKEKYYLLFEFPYPSGAGLHVGHPKGYTATDIMARYYHAKGYNVLHPMGFDAF